MSEFKFLDLLLPPLINAGLGGERCLRRRPLTRLRKLHKDEHLVGPILLCAFKAKFVHGVDEFVQKAIICSLLAAASSVAIVTVSCCLKSAANLGNFDQPIWFEDSMSLSNEIRNVGAHESQTKDSKIRCAIVEGNVGHITGRDEWVAVRNQVEGVHLELIFHILLAFAALFLLLLRFALASKFLAKLGIAASKVGNDKWFLLESLLLSPRLAYPADDDIHRIDRPLRNLLAKALVILIEQFRILAKSLEGRIGCGGVEILVQLSETRTRESG